MIDRIKQHLAINHHPQTLREYQQESPQAILGHERKMRLEYIDAVTRSKNYFDPTPSVPHAQGDAYGHIVGQSSGEAASNSRDDESTRWLVEKIVRNL